MRSERRWGDGMHKNPPAPTIHSIMSKSKIIAAVGIGLTVVTTAAALFTKYKINQQIDDIILSNATIQLFQQYAKLINKSIPSTKQIKEFIQTAYIQALATYPYRCVKELRFIRPRILNHPKYAQLIADKAELKHKKILDIGCCMGVDLRQMILDGADYNNVLGVDIQQNFLNIGMDEMFFDRNIMQNRFTVANILETQQTNAILNNFVQNGVDIIYVGSVYHLLDEKQCEVLSRNICCYLKPGGIVLGRTNGQLDNNSPVQKHRFLHSQQSLHKLLEQTGFSNISVEIGDWDNVERKSDKREVKPVVPSVAPPKPIWDKNNNSSGGSNNNSQSNEERRAAFSFYAEKPHK
jgi:predicted TPR repeat methyltransferase